MTSGVVALASVGLTKVFPVMDERSLWRVLFRPGAGPTVTAVDDVSLEVPKGAIVGVLGRNGAGKSTLLRLFGSVYVPTRGKIDRRGTMTGLFELGGIGHRSLTGREYARRALILQGVRGAEIAELVASIHAFTELGEAFDQPLYTYSAGMAARVYFASATARPYDVYLIDELLAVGDEHFQAKCWAHLRTRLSGGASGILVTHDWSAVLRFCTHSHIMERGRIVASGPTDEIVMRYLALARPPADVARFLPSNPDRYVAGSGLDADFLFDVELLESTPVVFAYSIERLTAGEAWDILLLRDNVPVAARAGRYRVCLRIPRMPLPAGRYHLNVFLTSPRGPAHGGPLEQYDVRGWTYGNGLELVVSGGQSDAAVAPPVEWECAEVVQSAS